MDSSTNQILEQAFDLIERNRQSEALDLIQPLLNTEPQSPDIWWIYAHAVSDPTEARKALDRVIALDPAYPGAAQLINSIDASFPALASPRTIKSLQPSGTPESLPGIPQSEDDLDFDLPEDWDDEDFAFADEEDEDATDRPRRSRSRRLLIPLLALLVIVAVVAAALIISGGLGSTTPKATATAVVQAPTSVPTTVNPTLVPTEVEPTDVPTAQSQAVGGDFPQIRAALSAFAIPDDGIQAVATNLGNTLRVTICGDRSGLNDAMQTMAENSDSLTDIEAIAVQIGDCTVPEAQRAIGVTMDNVSSFVSGEITWQDFQRLWQPVS